MDNHFVPNLTFGPQLCRAIRPHIKTVMDVHLMIAPVDASLTAYAEAYADRTEADHAALAQAVTDGRIEAVTGI